MAELTFDLTPHEEPVTIGGKRYTLREASEDAATKFKNAQMKAARFTDGKLSAVEGAADVEALLVSLCLFEAISDDAGNSVGERPVPLVTVRGWPARVVKPIYLRIKEVSLMDEDDGKDLPGKIAKLREELARLEKQQAESQAKN